MTELATLLFGAALDRTAIWTAVLTLVTLVAVLVAWRQLSGLRAVSRADFTFRFIESFFTSDTRTLFTLLMNSAITFVILDIKHGDRVIDRLPYLKIDHEIAKQLSGLIFIPEQKTGYTAQEVDDLLLGHFESLGRYVKNKMISFDLAYNTFSYYVEKTYEHKQIKAYLADNDNRDTYEDFPYLYKRFKRRSLKRET
jgi:hypothetical protein